MSAGESRLSASRVGRASRTLGQLWQVPTFLVGLLALALVAATSPLRRDYSQQEFDDALEQLRQALKQPGIRLNEQLPLAEDLLKRSVNYSSHKVGQAHFLAGWLCQRLAEQAPPDDAAALHQKATTHLQTALASGVAEEDRPGLHYRLGAAFFQKGTDPEQAIDYLKKGVEAGTDEPARGYSMLVKLYMSMPKVDLDAALAANQKQLLYIEDEVELHRARLVRGELLFRKGRRIDAIKELEAIGTHAPRDVRLKARRLQARCCEDEGLWNQAIPLYKELLAEYGDTHSGRGRILFCLGRCYANAEPQQIVEAQENWRAVGKLGGEEGQASGLLLGSLLMSAGGAQREQVVSEFTAALATVQRPADYHNGLVSLADARKIIEKSWNDFHERKQFASAEQVATLYRKIADRGVAEEKLGQTDKAWAKDIEATAAMGTPAQIDEATTKIHEKYVRAAQAYEQAADARPLDEQPPLLWKSAKCYLLAKDVPLAISLLRRFVLIHNTEEVWAEGWLALADALLVTGQKEQARQAFYKCIEFPNTPFAYRARYQLAVDAIQEGNPEQAESILKQNLTVTGPSIDREAHGKSLYECAKLLYERKNYDQASLQLKEAIRQYPNDPKARVARDHLGACYRQLALDVDKKLKGTLTPESKRYLTTNRQNLLEEACRVYQDLADDLGRKAKPDAPLTPEEQALYRKSSFAVADLRKDLNEMPEALRRYRILLDRYRGEPEGLLACNLIWSCASVMYLSPEHAKAAMDAARDAIQKTLEDVDKMGPEHAAFKGPDRTSHEQWLRWLRQASNRLDALANPPATRPPALQ
ncbi:MAG: tetratricopeptide repeat protein [Planctomycetes bacterium]|nr:tetratricopeptide repeat protein [Planctomycetota bacterium]